MGCHKEAPECISGVNVKCEKTSFCVIFLLAVSVHVLAENWTPMIFSNCSSKSLVSVAVMPISGTRVEERDRFFTSFFCSFPKAVRKAGASKGTRCISSTAKTVIKSFLKRPSRHFSRMLSLPSRLCGEM